MKKYLTGLAIIIILVALIPATAQAESYMPLYDTGDSAAWEHSFTVYQNESLNINGDPIEFAVKCDPASELSPDITYIINITLNDGNITNSYEITVYAANETVWANVMVDPTIYEYNNRGTINITLTDDSYNYLDSQEKSIGFYRTKYGGYFSDIYYLIMFAGIVALMGIMAKKTIDRMKR